MIKLIQQKILLQTYFSSSQLPFRSSQHPSKSLLLSKFGDLAQTKREHLNRKLMSRPNLCRLTILWPVLLEITCVISIFSLRKQDLQSSTSMMVPLLSFIAVARLLLNKKVLIHHSRKVLTAILRK